MKGRTGTIALLAVGAGQGGRRGGLRSLSRRPLIQINGTD